LVGLQLEVFRRAGNLRFVEIDRSAASQDKKFS